MSDFIFSQKNIEQNEITKKIQSIYHEDKPFVQEYHGKWGSLGVSRNLYNGFNPYENDEYIVVVIGGPVFMFMDNNFLVDEDSSDGTIAIFQLWVTGKMEWDEDLSGPFVVLIVNKKTYEVICVTDLMSFIPVYSCKSRTKEFMLSTHVDALAKISKQEIPIDTLSEIDFILHGVVTYPYTFYTNIFQIAPATVHKNLVGSNELKSSSYWIPKEEITHLPINDIALQLRKSIKDFINKIISQTNNIAQFISGGEDSRVLSALLQHHSRNAYVFLDQMNREGETAQKVANIYGANFKLTTRDKLHYLNILQSCSDLVGSGSQYRHAHTYGFHKSCKLQSYSAVFGGLFSDALLKGARIKKVRRTGELPFIPEIKRKSYSAGSKLNNPLFNENALVNLAKRRQDHLEYIQSFRSESAEEWFELWPSSMNMNIPNLHANRRLFRSYEPFMSNKVVKISAKVPQKWKLNRRLFQKTAKPLLKPTQWLPHGDGWYPYYSWPFKSVMFPLLKIKRRGERRLGSNQGNQGPWGDWNTITSSEKWRSTVEEYVRGAKISYSELDEQELFKAINSIQLNTRQRVNYLQTLYWRNH